MLEDVAYAQGNALGLANRVTNLARLDGVPTLARIGEDCGCFGMRRRCRSRKERSRQLTGRGGRSKNEGNEGGKTHGSGVRSKTNVGRSRV
jgi:hypothetical protein